MKTVTLGNFRFREQNSHVYVYQVIDAKHEKYIGALHKLLSPYLDFKDLKDGGKEGIKSTLISTNAGVTSDKELERFMRYCLERASELTCREYVNYLRKPLTESFNSVKAWRMYFKMKGKKEELKKLKLRKSGSDLRYVSEEEIRNALAKSDEESRYIISLLLESGARLSEVVKILSEYDPEKDKRESSYFIYEINWSRGKKRAYYFFHVSPLRKLSLTYFNIDEKLRRYINPKMVRKFVASKMYELGMRAETIDFIQGRAPQSIGTQHYIYLFTTAKKEYEEKWVPYLQSLLKTF